MVTFDSHAVGTRASAWEAAIAALPPIDFTSVTEVVVVAAHPDDESLGAGGLISEFAARGIPVRVIIVTDGAASHPRSPTTSSGERAAVRREEAATAVRRLSAEATLTLLDFPDGEVRENTDAIRAALATSITGRPLLVSTWRSDGHRDHRIVGELCAEIANDRGLTLAEYPIWLWHWGAPEADLEGFASMPIGVEALAAKRSAIHAHESQVSALSDAEGDEAMLDPAFLEHFYRDREVYLVTTPSLPSTYFDDLYARHDDPWQFTTRWYESRKRAITLASLPDERYGRVLEIGCSIGVLTELLAGRADELVAIDVSETAVERARARLAGNPSVSVIHVDAEAPLPDGPFDLIVLSEVGYYFSAPALESLLDQIEDRLGQSGTLVACHWQHTVTDYPQTGAAVDAAINARGWATIARHVERDFIMDVVSYNDRSVAQSGGLA